MKASIVDFRYRMNEILKAMDRNEEVTILYHAKRKGSSSLQFPGVPGGY